MSGALPFAAKEFAGRLAAVKARMQRRGIEVLLISDPCNMYYLAGYDAWSFYVPQVLIVALERANPLWIGRAMDARGATLTTWLDPDDIHAYDDSFVQSADAHPMEFVVKCLREHGLDGGRIGVELGNYYLGAKSYLMLADALGADRIEDASLLVNWSRAVKSPAEIALMKQAARIVESAMGAALETIRPGVRECDAAAAIYSALMTGTPEFGGTYASSPPLIPAGERVNTPHLTWTDRPYQAGMQVNLELVASRLRYHTPLGRTFVLGEASPILRQLEAATLAGIEAALGLVRPGVTAAEVEAVWQGAAARYGVTKAARCGYSIGIAYPPTFGEQTISLRPGDDTVLEVGMTLHLMPAVWLGDKSLVLTEPFVVTETGAECLCDFPRRLLTLD